MELESWSEAANKALQDSPKEQRAFIEKVNDLESRGRRNNLRIYGVHEDLEGSSDVRFVEKLLVSEKRIKEWTDSQVQCAYRSLRPKPNPNAHPRSIVVNFLQNLSSEMSEEESPTREKNVLV